MAVLFLNAYPVAFEGGISLWRCARSEDEDKRELERRLGVSLWTERDAAWSGQRPAGRDAALQSFDPGQSRDRTLFAAREGLVSHARDSGRDAWFGRAGEMSFVGLLAAQEMDEFVLEPELVARFAHEPYIEADAVIVVRARTRWRSARTLAEPDLQRLALGERAVRIDGDGPRRGLVDAVSSNELHLRVASAIEVVDPANYSLVAGSRLVVAWRGPSVLRELQVASGVLTISNRRNRYAVKDRFQTAGRMLRTLGWPVALLGDARMELGSPVAVRLEDAA